MYTYIYTYIHTYIHTCMHACIHAYIRVCVYIYIYMYTHPTSILKLPTFKNVPPALHENGLQRQKIRRSTGQQSGKKSASRPADKPVMNSRSGGSTAGFVPPSVYIGFRRCFWRVVQATCLRCFSGYEGGLSSRRPDLLAPSPARPRLAAMPCAPTRPARGMSGFWTRQVSSHKEDLQTKI